VGMSNIGMHLINLIYYIVALVDKITIVDIGYVGDGSRDAYLSVIGTKKTRALPLCFEISK
jgi:hypothetical protein